MPACPPWWAVVSSMAAPVLLIGGWTLAQAIRADGFDAVRSTISALAAQGALDRWIMTVGLVGLGLAYLVTAAGLTPVRSTSRGVLALAGLATVCVAVFPQSHAGSQAHGISAGVAFVLLALWPATMATRRGSWAVHPTVAIAVSVVSAALLLAFAAPTDAATRGAWERGLAAQQALWPLVVVLALRLRRGGTIPA